MTDNKKTKKKLPILTIIICILLSLVLIFGAVFGIINLVKYNRAVAYYGDVYIDEGEMNFLSSYYKFLFSKDVRINEGVNPDAEGFFDKTDKSGVKYSDRLKSGFKEYLTGILTAASIYDSVESFSKAEENAYNRLLSDFLFYNADGDEDVFNEATAEFGFDWDDFKSANVLLCKAQRAKEALFGTDGAKLIYDDGLCAEYLATYTHVDLLFIRLEDKFVLDENGGFTYDDDGNPITEKLTSDEIAEKQATVDKLSGYIATKEMSPETFRKYQKDSDGDKNMLSSGYYFNKNAETTLEFRAEFPEIVDAAYELELEEFRMVECEAIGGVCFIYKSAVAAGAYASETNPFFSDFFKDASDHLYPKMLKDLAVEVVFKDNFDQEKIVSQRKNNKFYIKSFD